LCHLQVDSSGLTIASQDRLEKLKEAAPKAEETIDEAGPINENLFLDEDLEGLDDELNDLDINDDDDDEEDTTENTDN
jgi:hypothetical protein